MEDLLFSNTDMAASPIVMAVKIHIGGDQRTVGVCFADATVRELGISEFIDNDLYSNFESLVIQLGIKECLVQADEGHKDYELSKIRSILTHCDIVITERKKSEFGIRDVEQDFNRLLEEDISIAALPEFELKNAMAASACVMKYLALLADETNFGQYTLRNHDLSQYMKLDASAVRALNLMPGPQDGSNKSMSLYGLLNKCKTSQGGRMLGQWLKQPLMDIAAIGRIPTIAFLQFAMLCMCVALRPFPLTCPSNDFSITTREAPDYGRSIDSRLGVASELAGDTLEDDS
jgi:DNA mismatch repair protein MSH2